MLSTAETKEAKKQKSLLTLRNVSLFVRECSLKKVENLWADFLT